MRRILLVLSAAALMAAMIVAIAVPAFAKENCNFVDGSGGCSGGSGGRTTFPDGEIVSGGHGAKASGTCDPVTGICTHQQAGGGGIHDTFADGEIHSGGHGGNTSETCDPTTGICTGEQAGGGGSHLTFPDGSTISGGGGGRFPTGE